MAILKYSYLSLGVLWYVFINVVSYTNPLYAGELFYKILFSVLSLTLMVLNDIVILKTEKIFKKPFSSLSLHTKIVLFAGVIIIPMISLYYST